MDARAGSPPSPAWATPYSSQPPDWSLQPLVLSLRIEEAPPQAPPHVVDLLACQRVRHFFIRLLERVVDRLLPEQHPLQGRADRIRDLSGIDAPREGLPVSAADEYSLCCRMVGEV